MDADQHPNGLKPSPFQATDRWGVPVQGQQEDACRNGTKQHACAPPLRYPLTLSRGRQSLLVAEYDDLDSRPRLDHRLYDLGCHEGVYIQPGTFLILR